MKNNRIRAFAASVGHEVVGKLRCVPIKGMEDTSTPYTKGDKLYMDDAGNEYWLIKQGGVCIVTSDGGVI